jgi:hypothetical protein
MSRFAQLLCVPRQRRLQVTHLLVVLTRDPRAGTAKSLPQVLRDGAIEDSAYQFHAALLLR